MKYKSVHIEAEEFTRSLPYSPGPFLSFFTTLAIRSEFQTDTLGSKLGIGSSTSSESRYNSCMQEKKDSVAVHIVKIGKNDHKC